MLLSQQDQVRLVRDVAELAVSMKNVAEDVREIKTTVGQDVAALRADIELLKKDRERVKVAIAVASSLGGAVASAAAWLLSHFGFGS
jgi:Mrp family chromosome partitioning ATPase